MKRICLFFAILVVSGLTQARAAEALQFGEIAGLLSVERIYANVARIDPIDSRISDWMQLFVRHGDTVEKGQRLAVYRNSRGRTVLEYIASRSGRVLVKGRTALDSLGTVLEIITVSHEEYCEVEDCSVAASE